MKFPGKTKETTSSAGGTATIIGSGVVFTGDVTSTADIRIDGTVKGNIECSARVLVGAEGMIEGNVDCKQADVTGKIKGNIRAKEILNLRGNANLDGDIFAAKLEIEPTAVFNGRCIMTNSAAAAKANNVVEMAKEKHDQPKAAAR
jgi:cytoskeletal protein CcmA (bactofilin family)